MATKRIDWAWGLLPLLHVGCAEIEVTPPVIHATLLTPYEQVTDQHSFPAITHNDVDPQYTVNFEIDATSGSSEDKSTGETEYHVVEMFTAVVSVPNVTFPDSMYTTIGTEKLFRTFARREPFIIPASAMGQQLSIRVEATDASGTPSNVLDFVVQLDP